MADHCERVFVIGIDGAMGRGMRAAKTPNIDALLADGVVSYSARTVMPSSSFQAWGAAFHGVGPEKHEIGREKPISEDVAWPSFMKVIKQARPDFQFAAFCCWKPIITHIIEPSVECHTVSLPDPEVAAAAAEFIRQSPPNVFYMHLDFVDAAGHRHGYGTDPYLEQIATTDGEVGQVLDAIKAAGILDQSLVMVLSDHGGFGQKHGTDHEECMQIAWGCRGPGIRSGGIELGSDIGIGDTPAVITRALGLPAPAGWDGQVPEGVFAD